MTNIRMRLDVGPALRELKAVLREMSHTAKVEMRDASTTIAAEESARIVSRGERTSKAAALAAKSVRVRRGETPIIAAGGAVAVRAGERGGTVTGSDIFFGNEFGGQARSTTQQFPPHRGREGYWFWPTLREDTPEMFETWAQVLDHVARIWAD